MCFHGWTHCLIGLMTFAEQNEMEICNLQNELKICNLQNRNLKFAKCSISQITESHLIKKLMTERIDV